MSRKIEAFKLPFGRCDHTIAMPFGAKILSCRLYDNQPFLYAMIDTECGRGYPRRIVVYTTGDGMDDRLTFIDTYQYLGDPKDRSVYFVFELG